MKKYFYLAAFVAVFVLTGASCIQLGGSAAGPMGMFRSTDKGETWQPIVAFPTAQGVQSIAGVKVYKIFTDPSDPNAMYLGSRGQGLFYTYDNGTTWQTVPYFQNQFIYGLAVDPKDKCTIYVTEGANVIKTTDCARTWKIIFTEQRPSERIVSVAVDFGDSKSILIAEKGGDILVSGNGGGSWKVANRFGLQLEHLVADPLNPKRLYLASYRDGLWRSDDTGATWRNLSASFDSYSDSKTFYRLVFNAGKKDSLFWISKYGILRSDNAGDTWTDLKLITPPGSVNIYGFAVNPQNEKEMYYTGTLLGDNDTHIRSTFYKSVDGGVNWITKKLPTNSIPVYINVHLQNASEIFMGFSTFK